MKILVVDDEAVYRWIIVRNLKQAGHTVLEADNGEAAWQVLQQDHCPMVVTDWMMPELDGPGLVKRVREANWTEYTYFIILTALDERRNVLKGQQAGTDDYLTKPVDPDELLARVIIGERILRLEASLREARQQNP